MPPVIDMDEDEGGDEVFGEEDEEEVAEARGRVRQRSTFHDNVSDVEEDVNLNALYLQHNILGG